MMSVRHDDSCSSCRSTTTRPKPSRSVGGSRSSTKRSTIARLLSTGFNVGWPLRDMTRALHVLMSTSRNTAAVASAGTPRLRVIRSQCYRCCWSKFVRLMTTLLPCARASSAFCSHVRLLPNSSWLTITQSRWRNWLATKDFPEPGMPTSTTIRTVPACAGSKGFCMTRGC